MFFSFESNIRGYKILPVNSEEQKATNLPEECQRIVIEVMKGKRNIAALTKIRKGSFGFEDVGPQRGPEKKAIMEGVSKR